MKDYLKKAIEKYPCEELEAKINKGEPLKINPISKIDADIIVEIIELLRKYNSNVAINDAISIIEQWKYLKDTDILNKLIQLNLDVSKAIADNSSNEGGAAPVIRYLNINGSRIDLNLFISHEVYETSENGNIQYVLKLNPVHEKSKNFPMYANLEFNFSDIVERDNYATALDSYLFNSRGYFLDCSEEKEAESD